MAAVSVGTEPDVARSLIGSSVRRVEDALLLTGRGHFVGDVTLPRMTHVVFVRAWPSNARIVSIDVSRARPLPGVVAVLTAADLPLASPVDGNWIPGLAKTPHPRTGPRPGPFRRRGRRQRRGGQPLRRRGRCGARGSGVRPACGREPARPQAAGTRAHPRPAPRDPFRRAGALRVLQIVGAEDCGTVINPLVVEGQFIGGVAQGLGGALLKRLFYNEDGEILTTTFMDYLMPTSTEMPHVQVEHIESQSPNTWRGIPNTWRGIKGVGESGAGGRRRCVGAHRLLGRPAAHPAGGRHGDARWRRWS